MEIGSAYLTDFYVSFILVIRVIRGRGRELRICDKVKGKGNI